MLSELSARLQLTLRPTSAATSLPTCTGHHEDHKERMEELESIKGFEKEPGPCFCLCSFHVGFECGRLRSVHTFILLLKIIGL